MSDEAKPKPVLTEEQKAKEARINARIAELKECEGKIFKRNDGNGSPVVAKRYAGIFFKDGQGIYTFEVEIKGEAHWFAPATDFLNSHTCIGSVEKTEINNEPI